MIRRAANGAGLRTGNEQLHVALELTQVDLVSVLLDRHARRSRQLERWRFRNDLELGLIPISATGWRGVLVFPVSGSVLGRRQVAEFGWFMPANDDQLMGSSPHFREVPKALHPDR